MTSDFEFKSFEKLFKIDILKIQFKYEKSI